jgi:peptidyl-prolyl cis-trans isomerase D
MLQDFRENLRGTAVFIVILISIPFALVGIDQIFMGGGGSESELSVNGEEVSKLEVDQALALHKQSLLEQYESLDPAMLDDELLREPVKYRLIREKVMSQRGHAAGLGLDDEVYRDMIRDVELFQSDGLFDRDVFEFALRQRGHTQKSYYDSVKDSLVIAQMASAMAVTATVTDREIVSAAELLEQKRSYYYLTIPIGGIGDSLTTEESAVTDYYQQNPSQFETKERVIVDYLELKVEDLMTEVDVDDELVKEQFEIESIQNSNTSRSRIAHILFANENDSENDQQAAQVQSRLSEGTTFGDLARQFSDDPGSASQGGDLGYVELTTLPESFAEAVRGLKVGEVSQPVITDSGVHLIHLVDRETAEPLVYELEAGRIRKRLLRELAEQLLPEKIDSLRELSYNAESLSEVANELNMTLKTTDSFTRNGGEGISAFPAIIQAAFGDEILTDGHASDVIELNAGHVSVIKLREFIPARIKQLSEVKDAIEKQLIAEAAQQRIQQQADDIIARVGAGDGIEELAKEEGLAWQVSIDTKRFGGLVNEEVRNYVFGLPGQSTLPYTSGLTMANGDYVVVSLTKVDPGQLDNFTILQRDNLRDTIRQNLAQHEYRSYEASLVAKADVEGYTSQ